MQQGEQRIDRLAQQTEQQIQQLDQRVSDRLQQFEQRLLVELGRHTSAIREAMRTEIKASFKPLADLPGRVSRLEVAVFGPRPPDRPTPAAKALNGTVAGARMSRRFAAPRKAGTEVGTGSR